MRPRVPRNVPRAVGSAAALVPAVSEAGGENLSSPSAVGDSERGTPLFSSCESRTGSRATPSCCMFAPVVAPTVRTRGCGGSARECRYHVDFFMAPPPEVVCTWRADGFGVKRGRQKRGRQKRGRQKRWCFRHPPVHARCRRCCGSERGRFTLPGTLPDFRERGPFSSTTVERGSARTRSALRITSSMAVFIPESATSSSRWPNATAPRWRRSARAAGGGGACWAVFHANGAPPRGRTPAGARFRPTRGFPDGCPNRGTGR